jgi:hypothetical protein
MIGRSKTQILLTAYALDAIGVEACTADTLLDCLRRGDAAGRTDAVLELGASAAPRLMLEYDCHHWHGKAKDFERDLRNTQRMLDHDAHAIVARVRVGIEPLRGISSHRLV